MDEIQNKVHGRSNEIAEKKQKIRERYKGIDKEELILIPAKPPEKLFEDTSRKRVCAYCRVSTDDVAQTSSYELQKNHYEEMIREHEGWELVDIYADEGISGTSLKHRDNFNRMIRDCNEGLIDVIVTKSVSRFARNIVDCIKTIRDLADLKDPVGVFFEAEHFYSLDNTSEMMLAVLSAAAQEESRTKSEIMNISVEQRFSRGIFLTPELLGYDRDDDGNLIVNEVEADTVKLCYYLYICGYSSQEIADLLMELGCKTKLGNTKWSSGTVISVIRNERHCGMVLCHKTYTPNYLDHKSKPNRGARNQWGQLDHHEPIVTKKIYDVANKMITERKHYNAARSLPTMQVIPSGILKGYIPVDRSWHGFSYEQYKLVSDRIQSGRGIKYVTGTTKNSDSLRGFKTVNHLMFVSHDRPQMTLARGSVAFNTVCLKKMDTEYVELLLNIHARRVAIRPCTSTNSNSLDWGKKECGKWKAKAKACSGLMLALVEMMGWEPAYTYKIQGQYNEIGSSKVIIFDLDDAQEIIKGEAADSGNKPKWLISYEERESSANHIRYIDAYPDEMGPEFAQAAETVENLDIFDSQEEKQTINEISEEEIQRLLIEAEHIIERIRSRQ